MVYRSKRGRCIKNRDKRNKESDCKSNNESKDERKGNYISVRVRLCAATPPSIIANRTPPPPSQKHHFTHKHQINFCIDEIHRAPNQREGADISAQLNICNYGTSNCKPEASSGIRE